MYLSEIHGERSRKLSQKWYQKASSLLNLYKKDEAVAAIMKAIDISENPAVDLDTETKEKDEAASPNPMTEAQ